MKHNFIEQPNLNALLNDEPILDTYFVCEYCKIIKVVRGNCKIDYLFDDGFVGKLLNSELACLQIIK